MTAVIAFGNFDLDGDRSWAIRTGLAEHGLEVSLCRTDAKGVTGKYRDLSAQWKKLDRTPDAIYVPFLGHWILPLAWRLGRKHKIPVIFDAFLSLYDTEVGDRKRLSRLHPKAWFLWCTDWLCCRLCDTVLIDTEEHKEYFVRSFGVKPEKILVLPIGCRTDLFRPLEAEHHDDFRVVFHGTFIPLQGIDTIISAASILQTRDPHVRFEIIGKGQTYAEMKARIETLGLRHISLEGMVPMAELPHRIAAADVCLGIFGTTTKADRVIPNKAYEILACGKPLITGKTTAASRVLRDGQDCLLTEPGNAPALADAILRLKKDDELRRTIAENGHRLSLERFMPAKIVEPVVSFLRERPNSKSQRSRSI